MASTIKLKNGSGAPLASDLVQGEPALDLTNKRLYTEDSGGTVIEVGTNPTELQVDNINIDGNAITSTDTDGNIAITPNGTGEVDISKVDIDGGAIDGTVIGGTTTAAGSFTTLQADTSLNVDGTVTADGLTVDGAVNVNGTVGDIFKIATTAGNADLWLTDTDTSAGQVRVRGDANSLKFITDTKVRHTIANNGDISFYEDTGTTAKFFWDASAEALYLGNTNPSFAGTLDVTGTITSRVASAGQTTNFNVRDSDLDDLFRIITDGTTGEARIGAASDTTPFMTFYTGSSEAMRITSSGNVGIGDNNPSTKLALYKTGDVFINIDNDQAGNAMTIGKQGASAYGATGAGECAIYTYDNSISIMADGGAGNTASIKFSTGGNTERMRIDSSGNVGIGVTPSAWDTAYQVIQLPNGGSVSGYKASAAPILELSSNQYYDGGYKYVISGVATKYTQNQGVHQWYIAPSGTAGNTITFDQAMTLDASGNLLVGSTVLGVGTGNFIYNDGFQVQRRDGNFVKIFDRTGSGGTEEGAIIDIRSGSVPTGSIGVDGSAPYFATAVGSTLVGIKMQGGSAPRIVPTDGIGDATDDVANIGSATERFKNLYLSGGVYLNTTGNPSTTGQGSAFVTSTNDKRVLQLATTVSTSEVMAAFYNSNGFVGGISTSGSSTSYATSSDYRLKENVVDMTGAVDRVKALNPSQFNFIADPDTTVDGFLAHEVADVVPEAVTGTKDAMTTEEYEVTPAVLDEDGNVVTEAVMGTREVPDYQGIDQSKLVPLLTGALQEAIARIETLEAQVATLQGN